MRYLILLLTFVSHLAIGAIALDTSGSNNAAGGPTSIVITPGATVSEDSVIYIGVCVTLNTATDPPSSYSSSGFTEIASISDSAFFGDMVIFRKVAGGSEPSTYTVSWTSGDPYSAAAGLVAYSGADTTTINGTPTTGTDTSSNTTFDIPALTTDYNNSLDIAFVCQDGQTSSVTLSSWGSSLTERIDNSGGEYAVIGIADAARATAGSQAATSVTSSNADNSLGIRLELIEDGAISASGDPFSGPFKGPFGE